MIASNRRTIQLSVLAAFATVAFGALSVSNAESVKPVVVETSRNAQASTNTIEEKKANERLLLRYTQLWNMYRFRNEVTMTEADKEKVDALMAEVQAPKLHADMTPKEIRVKISANAVELSKRLKVEMASGLAPDAAQVNLAYLQGTLVKRLSDPKLYAMSDKKFREEFLSVLPDDPSLPEAITNRNIAKLRTAGKLERDCQLGPGPFEWPSLCNLPSRRVYFGYLHRELHAAVGT